LFKIRVTGHILTVQSNPINFVQSKKLNVQSKLQNCAVQNMCFELSHKSTTREVISVV